MKAWLAACACFLFAIIGAPPAQALCIGCSCTISADPALQFNNINPLAGPPPDAVAKVYVNCFILIGLGTLSNEIRLSTGGANSYAPRRMSDGFGHTLPYNLYLPTNQVWGDGSAGTSYYTRSAFSLAVGAPVSYSVDVAGRVQAAGLSNVTPGDYDDTITVTVTW